jgi:hypothetical protein
MFLLTFIIGFIVALIIKLSVRGVELSQNISNEKYHQELRRLRSIKRIRYKNNISRLNKMEEANSKGLFYYGNRKKAISNEETNNLNGFFYGNA